MNRDDGVAFWLNVSLLVLGFSAASAVPVASSAADPRRVLAEARFASGGAAWDRVRSLRIRYDARANGRAGTVDDLEDVETGRFVTREVFPPRTSADGFDGVSVWTQGLSGVSYVLGDEDARLGAVDNSYRVERGWWFRDRTPATLEDAGEQRDAAGVFDRIRITPEGGRPFTLWINQKTHLIDRYVERAAERLETTRFANYRRVDGVLLPFVVRIDDQIRTIASVSMNTVFAQTAFSLPANPPSAAAAIARPVTVPFRLEDGEVIVSATLNGKGPFDCVFDSGGGLIVPPAVLARLHLRTTGAARVYGGGEGSTAASRGAVQAFSIGAAPMGAQRFDSFALFSGFPERMLAGQEVLQQYVVRLDFDRMQMTLVPPRLFHNTGMGVVIPFHFQDNQPEVIGAVDGIAARMAVDTGDNGSLLLIAPFARRYTFAERYHAHYTYRGRSVSATHGLFKRVGTVVLDGVDGEPATSVSRPVTRISLQEFGFDANRYVSANLGIGILKQFNVTFDYARHLLILQRSHYYGKPDIFDRTGMRLHRRVDRWTVTSVYAGSPAAVAGVHAGDSIALINGKPPNRLDADEVSALTHGPIGSIVRAPLETSRGAKDVEIKLRDLL